MEHVISSRPKRKHPFEIEARRLKKQNERLDNLNEALTFAIKALAVSAAFTFICHTLQRIL